MIIVEGPDGAGKSTLVEVLSKYFDIPVGERGTQDRSKLYTVTRSDTYRAISTDLIDPTPRVWDRLYYSEMIYAPLGMPKRKVEFNPTDQLTIGHLLKGVAMTIVCYPRFEVVQANIKGTEQMSGVHERIPKIWTEYGKLQPANAVWYDYTGESKGAGYRTKAQLLDAVEHHIETRERRIP